MDSVDIEKAIGAAAPDVIMPFQVKPYDIDVAGVVHNSVYLCWLDDLRCEFLTKVLSVEEQVQLGFIPVISRTDIRYRRPIKFGDKVVSEVRLINLGKIKWSIECAFSVGGKVVTEVTQEGCVVDLKTHRPIIMPESFQAYWQAKIGKLAIDQTDPFKNAESSVEYGIDMFSDQAVVCPV